MQEDQDRLPLSSHVVILKAVTCEPRASFNGRSTENSLPPIIHPIDTDEPKPRPDMITCFRRLYMVDQFNHVSKTTQPLQDQYAVKNIRL